MPHTHSLDFALDLAPLIVIAGKGGVGKSYVAHRLATALSTAGEHVAVVRFANDSRAFEKSNALYERVLLSPEHCFTEQAARIIGSRRLARTVLEHRAIRRALVVVPGVREVAMLMSLTELTHRYDRVVADLPATGHSESWLRAPQLLLGVVDGGRAATMTEALTQHLSDPSRTSFVAVTTPEPFVLKETQRLCDNVRAGSNVETAAVVLNRAPTEFGTHTRRAVWTVASSRHPAASDAARLARALSDRHVARAGLSETLERLSATAPLISLTLDDDPQTAPSQAA